MKKLLKAFATVAALAMLGTSFMACASDDDGGSSGGSGTVNAHLVKFNAEGDYNAEGTTIHKKGGSEVNGVITGEAYMVLDKLINPEKDHVKLEAIVKVLSTSGHNGLGLISVTGSERKGYALLTGQNVKHTGCTLGGGGNGLSPAVDFANAPTYKFVAEYKDNKENYYVYDLSGNLLGKNEGIAMSHASTDLVYPAFGGTTAAYSVYKDMVVTINGTTYNIDGLDEQNAMASVNVSKSTVRMLLDAEEEVTYSSFASGGADAGINIEFDNALIEVTDDGNGTLKIKGLNPTTGTTIKLSNKSNASLKTTITVVVEDFTAADDYGTLTSTNVYPLGANAYEDAELRITFDAEPTLS